MVHVSSTTWRIKNQPSTSTSCSNSAIRLLVLVAGILYWGLQVTSSFSIRGCVLKSCFERYILKGQIAIAGHRILQSWTLVCVWTRKKEFIFTSLTSFRKLAFTSRFELNSGTLKSNTFVIPQFRKPMIGENQQLVTDEPVEFEKWPVEVKDCRKITDHFRGNYRIYPNLLKENRRMPTCNRFDLQTLGSQPMIGENRQWVTDEPVKFEIWPVEVQDCSKITDHFRGIYRILFPNLMKGTPEDVDM